MVHQVAGLTVGTQAPAARMGLRGAQDCAARCHARRSWLGRAGYAAGARYRRRKVPRARADGSERRARLGLASEPLTVK
jgi:hypothetical protein